MVFMVCSYGCLGFCFLVGGCVDGGVVCYGFVGGLVTIG